MDNNLNLKCEALLQMAIDTGADACDVILSKGESFSLSAQNNEIDKYKVAGSQVIGLRVVKDSKIGLSYSESLDENSLQSIASAAIESAINSEINEYESISTSNQIYNFPSKFLKEESVSTQEKIDFCLNLEGEVRRRDSRVQSVPYNGYTESSSATMYLNSNSVRAYKSDYHQSCYTSALLQDGDKSSMHHHSSIARLFSELDAEQCISESLRHASLWMDATALKTGTYDIIFTPDVFSEIFHCFSSIFSGKTAMEKTNPFLDKLGKKIGSHSLTVKDLPLYENSFSKYYFDSEGVGRKDLTIIEDGILNSFYQNTVTAKFFKIKTTAHASRGAKSSLGISGTTKVISAGTNSDKDLKTSKYFEVHALQGLQSGANISSGDFSFAATGYLCRDGNIIHPVRGVTVSGNFYEMLLNINIIGQEILPTSERDFFAPLLRFENMSVAGS